MNEFEITELGQVREQENMLERAQSQALRRARQDVDAPTGTALGGLIAWRRPFIAQLGRTKTVAAPRRTPSKPTHEWI
jgi:hypothetical protein